MEGHFRIPNVKPGKYRLKVSYISYNPALIEDVRVEAGKSTKLSIALTENTVALEGSYSDRNQKNRY